MNFNPDSEAWGINFQRHDCPQERSEPLDGLAAKPGAEQDEQCRSAHRHPGCDPGSWPRREAVRGRHVGVVPGTWRLQGHERRDMSASTCSTTSRRSSGPTSPSTPTSRRRKSMRARSTSHASRCCSPKSAISSSMDLSSSISRARPRPKMTGGARGRRRSHSFLQPPDRARRTRDTPQRINFGSKLTGQAGAYDIGVFRSRQARRGRGSLGEDFAVMRIKRRMLRESYLGGPVHAAAHPGRRHRQSSNGRRRFQAGDVDVPRIRRT